MRVLLSAYRSRGDVEPLVGLAVRLPALGITTALTHETRVRAAAVSGTVRTDGATVAALLLDAVG